MDDPKRMEPEPAGQPNGPAPQTPAGAAADKPLDVSQLTPEEQMALFEKDLKENDWGHQPC